MGYHFIHHGFKPILSLLRWILKAWANNVLRVSYFVFIFNNIRCIFNAQFDVAVFVL